VIGGGWDGLEPYKNIKVGRRSDCPISDADTGLPAVLAYLFTYFRSVTISYCYKMKGLNVIKH
jgi:hypothetical protein